MSEQTVEAPAEAPQERQLPRAQQLYRLRHSTAHIMAQAVGELFPDASFAIGPPIKGGFYYDFDLPRPLTEEDFPEIEARMERIIKGNHPFQRAVLPRQEALDLFAQRNQGYKVELIQNLPADAEITTYTHDSFVDLCAGPHVLRTRQCKHFKLLRVSGAYWRGDAERPMLQRVYGTVWPTREELDAYLEALEEARRRDHRRLGRELDLFWFDDLAPGAPFWAPKGFQLYQNLVAYWRQTQKRWGYVEICNPVLYRKELYEQSGHWEHYKDNMFVMESHGHTMCLKPMNCPDTMKFFASRKHSYRDLPLRVAEGGLLHRNELPGALGGLTRVRQFMQDDAHIFLAEEQIQSEIHNLLQLIDDTYGLFGMKYRIFLSTRDPQNFMGEVEVWDRAEAGLRAAIEAIGRPYTVNAGDAAFYGPKLDFMVIDSLGREWQTATIQLDFQLPERFNLKYTDRDNEQKRPVVIHRAVFGSFERFIGILVEHLAGAFPTWLAPVQARVLSITNDQEDYCQEVVERMRAAGLRVELDARGEKVNRKIAEAEVQKIPYMLVVGKQEVADGTLAVRTWSEGKRGVLPIQALIDEMLQRERDRVLDVKLSSNDLWSQINDVDVAEDMAERGF
jgi:threonyl-tRNA synthetase